MLVFMLYVIDGTRTAKQHKYARQMNPTLDCPVCSRCPATVLPTISCFLMYQINIQYIPAGYFLSESKSYIYFLIQQ